jgi:hypothetical protein
MTTLGQNYRRATIENNEIGHFIAIDAGLFMSKTGTNEDLSQANLTAYKQILQLQQAAMDVTVVGLNDKEIEHAHGMISFLSKKAGEVPARLDFSSVSNLDDGFFSVVITDRPAAFEGKVRTFAWASPHHEDYQNRFDI